MPVEMKNTVRVTRLFHFEAAHALVGHDGECKNIHGHSYKLEVTVIGKVSCDLNHPKDGMVVDFSIIKNIVQENVISKFDHKLILNKNNPPKEINIEDKSVIWLEVQPTCENLLLVIRELIENNLPQLVSLHHLLLRETKNSFAEYYPSDNS